MFTTRLSLRRATTIIACTQVVVRRTHTTPLKTDEFAARMKSEKLEEKKRVKCHKLEGTKLESKTLDSTFKDVEKIDVEALPTEHCHMPEGWVFLECDRSWSCQKK